MLKGTLNLGAVVGRESCKNTMLNSDSSTALNLVTGTREGIPGNVDNDNSVGNSNVPCTLNLIYSLVVSRFVISILRSALDFPYLPAFLFPQTPLSLVLIPAISDSVPLVSPQTLRCPFPFPPACPWTTYMLLRLDRKSCHLTNPAYAFCTVHELLVSPSSWGKEFAVLLS